MISGKISAPVFELENEKILNRHIFAVAISSFLSKNEDVYDKDNQTILLNENGYERLQAYLAQQPEDLGILLLKSMPRSMHERLGLNDWSWVEKLCGPSGVLQAAVEDFRSTVAEMEKNQKKCHQAKDDEGAARWGRALRSFRCSDEDNCGKKSLISFLVRNNVLPKYGFPVDTVELMTDTSRSGDKKDLQLARDLQMAIADYAPGAQVVADGKLYTSRYIRKSPGKNIGISWEIGAYFPECPSCGQPNFTKESLGKGHECVSCHKTIGAKYWEKTLEPRLGFCIDMKHREDPVPMHKPEHDYKTDDYYIGDPHRNRICEQTFEVNGNEVRIESTSNDSLVVVGQTEFKVCSVCGYADSSGIPIEHDNMFGSKCSNKDGTGTGYHLSHDFKTDVARITFIDGSASELNTMLSVLYALLEGLSREMGIERTDIKGCLFRTYEKGQMLFSIVLYDAVAGGAGHVRRLVSIDGKAFQRVLRAAYEIVKNCDCGSSCYKCLRNYYNQKIHDVLDRKLAEGFLQSWLGNMVPVETAGGKSTTPIQESPELVDNEFSFFVDDGTQEWQQLGRHLEQCLNKR